MLSFAFTFDMKSSIYEKLVLLRSSFSISIYFCNTFWAFCLSFVHFLPPIEVFLSVKVPSVTEGLFDVTLRNVSSFNVEKREDY